MERIATHKSRVEIQLNELRIAWRRKAFFRNAARATDHRRNNAQSRRRVDHESHQPPSARTFSRPYERPPRHRSAAHSAKEIAAGWAAGNFRALPKPPFCGSNMRWSCTPALRNSSTVNSAPEDGSSARTPFAPASCAPPRRIPPTPRGEFPKADGYVAENGENPAVRGDCPAENTCRQRTVSIPP